MAYVITEACVDVKSGDCQDVCPVDCIFTSPDDPQFYINPDLCIDCAACEPACPVNAIYFEDDVPDDMKQYIEINRRYFEEHSDEISTGFRRRTERTH
ncbi:MAG TPA: 4Fe-4S dicluster domain-containing protein [Dehalococcoidia bacterium]|nr:4Fe-4S dicluster domain-containing protein [Dehalococcoidia bacterium]